MLKDIIPVFEEQKKALVESGDWDKPRSKGTHIFFPVPEAIEYSKKQLTINPYFLGLLLGDGTITSDVTFTSISQETLNWITTHLNENFSGYKLNQAKGDVISYNIVNSNYNPKGKTREENKNILKSKLKELNLLGKNSHTKFIPEDYKHSTIEDRLELLRGLIDTDGYISKDGNVSYTTVSNKLANDVAEVVRSLGGIASIKEVSIKYKETIKIAFEVSITLPFKLGQVAKNNTLKVERYSKRLAGKEFFKKLTLKDIKPVGLRETICFLIDDEDHLFLANDYMVVHNTFHITKVLEALYGPADGSDRWSYHSGKKTTPFTVYKDIFMERKQCIVWDEADDILTNPDIVVMLKPVLDTSGKNTMEYGHGTVPVRGMSEQDIRDYCEAVDRELDIGIKNTKDTVMIPAKFFFDGQMIFISNLPAKKLDQAILSRSLYIDVQLRAEDIKNRIQTILNAKYPNDKEMVEEVMTALDSADRTKQLTVRTACIAIQMKQAGLPDWARLAATYA